MHGMVILIFSSLSTKLKVVRSLYKFREAGLIFARVTLLIMMHIFNCSPELRSFSWGDKFMKSFRIQHQCSAVVGANLNKLNVTLNRERESRPVFDFTSFRSVFDMSVVSLI